MPFVNDERKEKPLGQFLKLEDNAHFTIKSHSYRVTSHYLKSEKRTVICKGEGCKYCAQGSEARLKYYYWGTVDEAEGVIEMPPSVFFKIGTAEEKTKKSRRAFEWVASKVGSGMQTKYDAIPAVPIAEPQAEALELNKNKLARRMERYEQKLTEDYDKSASSDGGFDESEGVGE